MPPAYACKKATGRSGDDVKAALAVLVKEGSVRVERHGKRDAYAWVDRDEKRDGNRDPGSRKGPVEGPALAA